MRSAATRPWRRRFNVADGANGNSQQFGGHRRSQPRRPAEESRLRLAGSVASIRERFVNELRFQFASRNQVVRSLDDACGGECIGFDQGGPAVEVVGVARLGRHNFTPQPRENRRYQVLDTVSREVGRHLFKAGVDFNLVDNHYIALPLNFGSQFFFVDLPAPLAAQFGLPGPVNSIQAFALGLPVVYVQGFGQPSAEKYTDISTFVQDEWASRIDCRSVAVCAIRSSSGPRGIIRALSTFPPAWRSRGIRWATVEPASPARTVCFLTISSPRR